MVGLNVYVPSFNMGIVESILPVALNSLRVPYSAAVLITLVFRGVTVWFPLILGAVALRLLHRQTKRQAKLALENEKVSEER
jgi:uncharacterized membrane protein YbhN (UPF0104 family)